MHFTLGAWIAAVVGVVALLALALFQTWITLPLILVLIIGLAVARLIP
jgi:predicted cobalt transporter CbtA